MQQLRGQANGGGVGGREEEALYPGMASEYSICCAVHQTPVLYASDITNQQQIDDSSWFCFYHKLECLMRFWREDCVPWMEEWLLSHDAFICLQGGNKYQKKNRKCGCNPPSAVFFIFFIFFIWLRFQSGCKLEFPAEAIRPARKSPAAKACILYFPSRSLTHKHTHTHTHLHTKVCLIN